MPVERCVQSAVAGGSDWLFYVSGWSSLGAIPITSGAQEEEGYREIGPPKANLSERGRTSGTCVTGKSGFLVPVSVSSQQGYVIADSCSSLYPRENDFFIGL